MEPISVYRIKVADGKSRLRELAVLGNAEGQNFYPMVFLKNQVRGSLGDSIKKEILAEKCIDVRYSLRPPFQFTS